MLAFLVVCCFSCCLCCFCCRFCGLLLFMVLLLLLLLPVVATVFAAAFAALLLLLLRVLSGRRPLINQSLPAFDLPKHNTTQLITTHKTGWGRWEGRQVWVGGSKAVPHWIGQTRFWPNSAKPLRHKLWPKSVCTKAWPKSVWPKSAMTDQGGCTQMAKIQYGVKPDIAKNC